MLTIDPGKSTGITLGFYDAITPYLLKQRWAVLGGTRGFLEWWRNERPEYDELVIEKFILDGDNEFTADLTPVEIEGLLVLLLEDESVQPMWQLRSDKGLLTGYPPTAKTKAQRQRVRFNFLDRFGLFKPGTANDDSNDCVTHSLVNLKKRKHGPTLMAFWPKRSANATVPLRAERPVISNLPEPWQHVSV
jgi:hypothetical protein